MRMRDCNIYFYVLVLSNTCSFPGSRNEILFSQTECVSQYNICSKQRAYTPGPNVATLSLETYLLIPGGEWTSWTVSFSQKWKERTNARCGHDRW